MAPFIAAATTVRLPADTTDLLDTGAGRPRGSEFVFARLRYETGDWDYNPKVAAKVVAGGGQIVLPKMAIPGVGYLAYCTDPAGLIFGIMHPDPAAK